VAAFEINDSPMLADIPNERERVCEPQAAEDRRRVKDESIVANKVYDSCRRQNCLTVRELGPARAYNPETHSEGEIIVPPADAASVNMDKLTIRKIQVVDKQPSPFRAGYWDTTVRFLFGYCLVFRDASGKIVDKVECANVFNMKTTLFGSVGADLVIGTDLYRTLGDANAMAPFMWIEAKGVGLDAKIHHHHHGHGHGKPNVHVTIGLFTILLLFRMVHLNVQSKGFIVPDECPGQSDINPCDYFSDLDFPIDIFAPPVK